jgi:hypothetical protein
VEGQAACEEVCVTLEQCAAGGVLAECRDRCEQSLWVEFHELPCLALRVYWIDEEGCEVMLATYAAFDASDTCMD